MQYDHRIAVVILKSHASLLLLCLDKYDILEFI